MEKAVRVHKSSHDLGSLFKIFIFTLLSFTLSNRAFSTTIGDFKGIYVFINVPRISSANPKYQEIVEAVTNPNVDGITIMDRWADLEPLKPGELQWDEIDRWIRLAVVHKKKISFGLAGGAATPRWLTSAPISLPFVDIVFDRNPNSPISRSNGVNARVPLPWSAGYKYRFNRIMQEVKQHFQDLKVENYPAGSAYSALRIVKIGGFGLGTYELRSGATAYKTYETVHGLSNDPIRFNANPSSVWVAAGFTPAKMLAAWTSIASNIDIYFPDKLLSTDVVADFQAFANVNNQLDPFPVNDSIDPLTESILLAGVSMFPGRFSMQWDAYGLAANRPIIQRLLKLSSGANVAWQLNNLGGNEYTGCGMGTACNPAQFSQILNNGISLHNAKFIEVHIGNASDGAFSEGLAYAQSLFK